MKTYVPGIVNNIWRLSVPSIATKTDVHCSISRENENETSKKTV